MRVNGKERRLLSELQQLELVSIRNIITTGIALLNTAVMHHQSGNGRAAALSVQKAQHLLARADRRLLETEAIPAHTEELYSQRFELDRKLQKFPPIAWDEI